MRCEVKKGEKRGLTASPGLRETAASTEVSHHRPPLDSFRLVVCRRYDYDSEFQDKYTRIAVALIEGHIDVHKALQYQIETKQGRHTARSGLFLRDFPGRLVLYPLEAATCTVIFFGGRWEDGGARPPGAFRRRLRVARGVCPCLERARAQRVSAET